MTTLIAWLGVDSRGPSSIYFAADSRITMNNLKWDHGQKLFCCHNQPLIFGYCGEVLFPSQIIGQIVERIDAGLLETTNPESNVQKIVETISLMLEGQPGNFSLVIGQRFDSTDKIKFHLHFVEFKKTEPPIIKTEVLPEKSGLIGKWGSGSLAFSDFETQWKNSDVGGTSRAVFSAFSDCIGAGKDKFSGPPPQLVGLYRKGQGRPFGVIWNNRRYFLGSEIPEQITSNAIKWHNNLFEICDPNSLQRAIDSQPQPRPSQFINSLEKDNK